MLTCKMSLSSSGSLSMSSSPFSALYSSVWGVEDIPGIELPRAAPGDRDPVKPGWIKSFASHLTWPLLNRPRSSRYTLIWCARWGSDAIHFCSASSRNFFSSLMYVIRRLISTSRRVISSRARWILKCSSNRWQADGEAQGFCYELVDLNYGYKVTLVTIFKSKSNGVEM